LMFVRRRLISSGMMESDRVLAQECFCASSNNRVLTQNNRVANDVFISHSKRDKLVAEAICNKLESTGIRCWIAFRDEIPGGSWEEGIMEALASSKAMVIVFSNHANASDHVKREVAFALQNDCVVIPFRIEETPPTGKMKYYLDGIHWLDALTPPLEKHLETLRIRVRQLLPERETDQIGSARKEVVADQPRNTGNVGNISPHEFHGRRTGGAAPPLRPGHGTRKAFPVLVVSLVLGALLIACALVLAATLFFLFKPSRNAQQVAATSQTAAAQSSAPADVTDNDKVINDSTKIIRVNPSDPQAYCDRGIAYSHKKEYDKAVSDFTEAIRLNPSFAQAYSDRAGVYNEKQEYDKAIADCTEAIRLSPNLSLAYNNRGVGYVRKHDYAKAMQDFSDAIRLNPNYAEAYSNRAFLYSESKDYDKGLSDCTEAIRLDPNNAMAYNNRGVAFSGKMEFAKSIDDYTAAIRINPQYAEAYFNRGNSYYYNRQFDLAISDFTDAIRLNPNFALAYNNRGYVYDQKSEYDKAISDYSEAIRLDAKYPDAYRNRGNALVKQGKPDQAKADFAVVNKLTGTQ
jgi:tetratricopeptide (TPR) repeat protein